MHSASSTKSTTPVTSLQRPSDLLATPAWLNALLRLPNITKVNVDVVRFISHELGFLSSRAAAGTRQLCLIRAIGIARFYTEIKDTP